GLFLQDDIVYNYLSRGEEVSRTMSIHLVKTTM
ncbi:MAG: hypothetical protein ACI897_000572, partial [Flavobacteriales bacterium]